MHFKNFDLNLLVVLDALLSERNVTRAAELLCVTQPAVSNALQRIRAHFDDQILVRHGRDMEMTPLARTLVGPVRELMLQTARLLEGDYQFDPATAVRRFRVSMSDYCASVLSGPLMRVLSEEAPDVRLEITMLSDRTIQMLSGGELDMLLTAQDLRMLEPGADPTLFGKVSVFEDDFVCAVDINNSEVKDTLTLENFLSLPHAIPRFGSGTSSIVERAIEHSDLQLKIAAIVPTFTSLPSVLPGTPIIVSLQRRLARQLAGCLPIRLFDPPIRIPRLEQTLYWHRRSDHDKAHEWLRDAIIRAAKAMDPA
jgi:DNA-binding transcriptional LysR family regulator